MKTFDQLEELRLLLPWHENGTLRRDERDAVRSLLASDFEANRQRRELRALRAALADDPALATDMAPNLRRLHARIDRRSAMPLSAQWLALAALVILAISVTTFVAGMRFGSYHTLTAVAQDSVPPGAELVRVDAASGIDAAALERIADDAQVRVLRGPSRYGVATLAVPRAHMAQVIARLSADPRLRFVAPVPRE